MRRRFGRRRRATERPAPIDPEILARLGASEILGEGALEPWSAPDVPESFARCGLGRREGEPGVAVVAASLWSGGDAALAALVCALRQPEPPRRVVAVAPRWDARSLRRLARLGPASGVPLEALSLGEAGHPAEGGDEAPGPAATPRPLLLARISDPVARGLHRRAAAVLEGLAAKHGGGARGADDALELVIAARPVARLRATDERAWLELLEPDRERIELESATLAGAFDRLEGAVRKRLAERGVRDGEEGMRHRRLPELCAAAGLHAVRPWPFPGLGAELLDAVGVQAQGGLAVVALREQLTLAGLAPILDAVLAAAPQAAWLVADAEPPLSLAEPLRLVIGCAEAEAAAIEVLAHVRLPVQRFQVEPQGVREVETRGASEEGAAARPAPPREAPAPALRAEPAAAAAPSAHEDTGSPGEEPQSGRRRRSRSRSRRGGRAGVAAEALRGRTAEGRGGVEEGEPPEPAAGAAPEGGEGYEEISLFDLDDGSWPAEGEGEAQGRRRGRRRRRRGRRGGQDDAPPAAERERPDASTTGSEQGAGTEPEAREEGAGRRRGRGGRRRGRASRELAPEAAVEDEGEDEEAYLTLSPDAPDPESAASSLPGYDDEEESEPESELERVRLERERRRRARRGLEAAAVPTLGEEVAAPARAESFELPRGRAALVAHADRASIFAATLLARDLRQLEGIWVYPQEELMTFFRSVATDLRETSPIFVVGFEPKPARDAIQAASLYRGRLLWFDHHVWPPEDRLAMGEAIGEAHLRLEPGGESPLPAAVAWCTRRSRFSDKLVDLATGRFSHHDFQRWGRVWWQRVGQLAERPGEHRADLDPLLVGRPSDLAKEAAHVSTPPPAELVWVSQRDFHLVHFGGLLCVVADVPPHLDLHLALRIARERFQAPLSLGRTEGRDVWVLGADDVTSGRSLDVSGMVSHLAEKFEWVEALSDADHVARFRARDIDARPDRIDEVIAEIGMGRTILEG